MQYWKVDELRSIGEHISTPDLQADTQLSGHLVLPTSPERVDKANTAMPVSFLSLPNELRLQILSYIDIDKYNRYHALLQVHPWFREQIAKFEIREQVLAVVGDTNRVPRDHRICFTCFRILPTRTFTSGCPSMCVDCRTFSQDAPSEVWKRHLQRLHGRKSASTTPSGARSTSLRKLL